VSISDLLAEEILKEEREVGLIRQEEFFRQFRERMEPGRSLCTVDEVLAAILWYIQRHGRGGSAHLLNILAEIHEYAQDYRRFKSTHS
jgi:hypothetical protein